MGVFCDVGCVQYWPGRLSDMLEMINCIKMKSDLWAERDFPYKWAAQNNMTHAADFELLKGSIELLRCSCIERIVQQRTALQIQQ